MQILDWERGSKSDSLYIRFSSQTISHSVELDDDIIIDVADDNTVVGLDIQHASEVRDSIRAATSAPQPASRRRSVKLQLVPT